MTCASQALETQTQKSGYASFGPLFLFLCNGSRLGRLGKNSISQESLNIIKHKLGDLGTMKGPRLMERYKRQALCPSQQRVLSFPSSALVPPARATLPAHSIPSCHLGPHPFLAPIVCPNDCSFWSLACSSEIMRRQLYVLY